MKRLVPVFLVLLALLGWLFFAQVGERALVDGAPAEGVASGAAAAPAELSTPEPRTAPEPTASQREPSPALGTPAQSAPNAGSSAEERVAFHGLVLDGASLRPLPGARLLISGAKRFTSVPEEIEAETVSDAEGRFVLSVPARAPLRLGHAQAAGYGAGTFVVDGRHDVPERAETIELLSASQLSIHVFGASGKPRARIQTDLVWPGESLFRADRMLFVRERLRWTALTDREGVAHFDGLPAETELAWNVLDPTEIHGRAGRIALAPGEERRLDVPLGGGARLFGHVRDVDGAPVPGLGLWLARASSEAAMGEGVGKAASDESGRYAFEEVQFGSYTLGPVASEAGYVSTWNEPFVVDRPQVELDLDVRRGLFLTGRAVGPEKLVAALEFLSARPVEGGATIDGAFEAGTFRIGPCAPGDYFVSASGGDTATRVVRASAGASDVELPVESTREVTFRVDEAHAGLEWVGLDLERHVCWFWSEAGSSSTHTLAPGAHALVATSADEQVAFLGRFVLGEDGPTEVRLHLEPGARCTFVHRAHGGTRTLRLSLGGEVFPLLTLGGNLEQLVAGASCTLLLPPRALVAELLEGTRVVARESLTLAPGERRRVVLEPR